MGNRLGNADQLSQDHKVHKQSPAQGLTPDPFASKAHAWNVLLLPLLESSLAGVVNHSNLDGLVSQSSGGVGFHQGESLLTADSVLSRAQVPCGDGTPLVPTCAVVHRGDKPVKSLDSIYWESVVGVEGSSDLLLVPWAVMLRSVFGNLSVYRHRRRPETTQTVRTLHCPLRKLLPCSWHVWPGMLVFLFLY